MLRASVLFYLLVLCFAVGSAAALSPPMPSLEVAEVTKRVEDWLAAHPEGLVLDLKDATPDIGFSSYPHFNEPSKHAADTPNGLLIYWDAADGRYITLGFSEPISPTTDLKTVQAALNFAAVDKLPMPGLNLPGWDFKPMTPISSFKEGIEVVAFDGKRIQVKIKTTFFAVYGLNESCPVIMDAPMPEGCYFEVRKDFPLTLNLDVPVFAVAKHRM